MANAVRSPLAAAMTTARKTEISLIFTRFTLGKSYTYKKVIEALYIYTKITNICDMIWKLVDCAYERGATRTRATNDEY